MIVSIRSTHAIILLLLAFPLRKVMHFRYLVRIILSRLLYGYMFYYQ